MISVVHGFNIGESVRSGAREWTLTAEHPIYMQPAAVEPIDERTVGVRRDPDKP
jgi:hypothetical protein